MQLITAIAVAILAAATASALPAATPTTSFVAPTGNFYLKTQLIKGEGSANKRFDNLYVTGYHTGAGENDATLSPNATETAFLNGTSLQFNFGSDVPWSMFPVLMTEYTAWQPVQINGGLDTSAYSAFSINATGLQWSDDPSNPVANEFAGWRVCDWWHGVPQLFWKLSFEEAERPRSCSDVNLIPVPA